MNILYSDYGTKRHDVVPTKLEENLRTNYLQNLKLQANSSTQNQNLTPTPKPLSFRLIAAKTPEPPSDTDRSPLFAPIAFPPKSPSDKMQEEMKIEQTDPKPEPRSFQEIDYYQRNQIYRGINIPEDK